MAHCERGVVRPLLDHNRGGQCGYHGPGSERDGAIDLAQRYARRHVSCGYDAPDD